MNQNIAIPPLVPRLGFGYLHDNILVGLAAVAQIDDHVELTQSVMMTIMIMAICVRLSVTVIGSKKDGAATGFRVLHRI